MRALGTSEADFNFWFYGLNPSKRYDRFELRRRNGGVRVIHAPIKPIKEIQRGLAELLSPLYEAPPYVHGYIGRRSILTNASNHAGQRWVLRIDIENFFPSIHFGRVRGLFLSAPFDYPAELATLLAQICCHLNELPHGAPTSPLISNLICRTLDREMARLARANRCYYSRYCDDLVFSTRSRKFPTDLAATDPITESIVAGAEIKRIVEEQGFKLNDGKTVLRGRGQRQMVTGLVTNEYPNVPQKFVRSLRNVLYIWERYGESEAKERFRRTEVKNRPPGKPDPHFRSIIRGKIQYVGSVKGWHSLVYQRLAARLAHLDSTFTPTDRMSQWPRVTFEVYCEGASDISHLRSAVRHFRRQERFGEIELKFVRSAEQGDDDLLKKCKTASHVFHPLPRLYVFDSDSSGVKRATTKDGSFKSWGNGVFSFVLPEPSFRPDQPVCIELLYDDQTLELKDDAGRRVYKRDEFDKRGRHLVEEVHLENSKASSLIPEKVIDDSSGVNVQLSKSTFADSIERRHPPFDAVNFSGFEPTLELIGRIRHEVLKQWGKPRRKE